jgi:hypothetical protein
LKGVSVFTGFITKDKNIIWVGKDEKQHRPIKMEDDRAFFMKEMSQYDK